MRESETLFYWRIRRALRNSTDREGIGDATGRHLYNGNISNMVVAIENVQQGATIGYTYGYDQLNRLKQMRFNAFGTDNVWNNSKTTGNSYKELISYDPDGNIENFVRHANNENKIDDLTYSYQPGTNRLRHVKDAVSNSGLSMDISNQADDYYAYDEIGNLTTEGSTSIGWNVYGKIKTITGTAQPIEYKYDPSGNRVSKKVGSLTSWYVRDAQGNTLAVYDDANNGRNWREQQLYGSSRLGIWKPEIDINTISGSSVWEQYGKKNYELSNHLGNVLATVSDRKFSVSTNSYTVDFIAAQDYYPGGMIQPGRNGSLVKNPTTGVMEWKMDDAGDYRYGFNGKENDNEVKGEGNQQDYGMRIYDPRLGRFLSVDKEFKLSPDLTPYRFAYNNPIRYVDKDGNYETDGHYWTVFMVAKLIGLDKATAQKIATLAEKPDTEIHSGHSANYQNYTWADKIKQKSVHSLIGSGGDPAINIPFAIAKVIYAQNDKQLGEALHYLGDAFAHQRINGSGYYGNKGASDLSFRGNVFEFLTGGSAEHSEAHGGKVGNAPDMIYKRSGLYRKYVSNLTYALVKRYGGTKDIDMSVINKMLAYAQKNKVSLIGIINYEVSKLNKESSFFIPMSKGLAPDDYSKYVENTKQYLKEQGVKFSSETVYSGENRSVISPSDGKREQGTLFKIH